MALENLKKVALVSLFAKVAPVSLWKKISLLSLFFVTKIGSGEFFKIKWLWWVFCKTNLAAAPHYWLKLFILQCSFCRTTPIWYPLFAQCTLHSRVRWISKLLKIKTGHLFSYVKLNFKASLFSCIFWFEAIFLGTRAVLVFRQYSSKNVAKTIENERFFKIGLKPTQKC